MDILMKYIVDEGLGMILVLFVIAEVIKEAKLYDKRFIPVTLIVISLGFTPWLLGGYIPENLVQAVLIAGGPILFHETWKNSLLKEKIE